MMEHTLQANLCNLLSFNESCSQQDKGHFGTGRGIIDSNLIHSTDLFGKAIFFSLLWDFSSFLSQNMTQVVLGLYTK